MEENKYDGICFLFLCAVVPLLFMIFFSNIYVKTAYMVLSVVSLLFWILLTGNKNFKCNTVFSTFITVLYLVVVSMTAVMNYPVGNMFYVDLLYALVVVSICFFLYNFRKSNGG